MLLGEYVQRLDSKNRLTLPAKFRPHFAHGVVVTKGLDGCLFAFDREGWERFTERQLARLDPFSAEGRVVSRHLFAGANEADLDGQGRVMITQPLMQHASLTRDVVVAGLRDFLEIWDMAAWQRQLAETQGSVEDVAERLSQQ